MTAGDSAPIMQPNNSPVGKSNLKIHIAARAMSKASHVAGKKPNRNATVPCCINFSRSNPNPAFIKITMTAIARRALDAANTLGLIASAT